MLKSRLLSLKEAVENSELVLGRTYFVMKSTDTRFEEFNRNHQPYLDGTPKVYTAIQSAMSNAEDYDRLLIGPGIWEEGSVINITQTGLKFRGYMTSGGQWGQPSIHAHELGTHICITVNAHQVELSYFGIHQQTADTGIEVGTTATSWRTHIHDVYFGGNAVGTYGLVMGNETASGVGTSSTIDAPSTIVERCHFQDWVNADIFMNCGYGSRVKDCTIVVSASAIGIQYYTHTTSRPFAFILDNRFTAVNNSNSTGVSVTRTPTAGYLMIDGNHFINFGSNNLCITKRTGYCGLNYLGITAIAIT